MCPPANTITMSAAPIARGANAPAPAPMTVQPIVSIRKNVPMNSVRYLFIESSLPWFAFVVALERHDAGQLADDVHQLRVGRDNDFRVPLQRRLNGLQLAQDLRVADKILVSGLIDRSEEH